MRRLGFWIKFAVIAGVSAAVIIEALSDNHRYIAPNNNHDSTPNNK